MSLDEIHPLIIHFPIALLSVGFLCDLLSYILQNKSLAHAGWWNFIFGVVSSVCALITGLITDLSSIPTEYNPRLVDEPFPVHENHASLQIFVVCIFLALMIWRINLRGSLPTNSRSAVIYLGVLGVAVAILFYGSHLGAVFAGRF